MVAPHRAKPPDPLDARPLEELAARCQGGDEEACRELLALLWPHWVRLARASRAMSRLRDEDHLASAVAHVAARFSRNRWRALSRWPGWQLRHPERGFGDFVRIGTANAVRDYVRSLTGGSTHAPRPSGPSPKRLLNELALLMPMDELGLRPPVTAQQTALQLLAFAERHLSGAQHDALVRWLSGESSDEIAAALGLAAPEEAQRLVRAAVATLRRRFAPAEASSIPVPGADDARDAGDASHAREAGAVPGPGFAGRARRGSKG